jgi:putative tryptophan/tyrosine transport system substrate-binding protein
MSDLAPDIHVSLVEGAKTWMAGPSPAMTERATMTEIPRRAFITLLAGAAAAWPLAARAQQAEQTRRVGVLMPFDAQDSFGREMISALREGLKERGWAEGRNIRIDERWIGRDDERRSAYATELVRAAPDVLFACFAGQLAALLRETRAIPIVFVGVSDPVAAGYVASFAHPGGNITGFVFFEPAMVGKWLGVLKEIAPALSRVGFMVNPEVSPHYQNYFSVFTNAAPKFKVEPITCFVGRASEIEDQIEALARQGGSGLLVAPDTFTALNRQLIAASAARHRIPAVYVFREAVVAGGLLSYGPEQLDVIRRSASYVDRIIRGEPPAELPIQAPVKFELVINMKVAQALGLEIPPTLLARVDEVIE